MSGVPQLGKKKQPRSDATEEPEPQKTDEHVDKKESGLTEKGQEIKAPSRVAQPQAPEMKRVADEVERLLTELKVSFLFCVHNMLLDSRNDY